MVDISDPATPIVVGNTATAGAPISVAVAGNHVYLVMGSGLQVADVSDPQSPVIVGDALMGRDGIAAYAVAVAGSYADLASGWFDEFGGVISPCSISRTLPIRPGDPT